MSLSPNVVAVSWLGLAVIAAVLTWRRPGWVGVWLGAALVAGGWAYAALAVAVAPPNYYPSPELPVGLAVAAAGAGMFFFGAVRAHCRGRPEARTAGAMAIAATGFIIAYFGCVLTTVVEVAAVRDEAWISVADVSVYHGVGEPGQEDRRAYQFCDRVVLPVGSAAGAIVGFGLGLVAFPRSRRVADLPTPAGPG